ncbi:hypothetical protein [Lactococcus lactis]|uniref:Uncharacterized protein n=2 Tax=Lactococcus TaxID=1357 RepID=A0AAP3Z0G6_9LACT|nr:hypothetical protein [Lactococcus lactis]MDG4976105.1 hypothetical protein [Lactococcus lactis]
MMYKKATIFIICMIIGMAIYVVMDYFIQNATPFRWIVIIATSAWFAYSSEFEEKNNDRS